jgi:hypothetical protein
VRTLLVVAALMLSGAGVATADTGLYGCGTRLDRTSALGWCHGTGSFSLDVTCADGLVEHSGTVSIHNGYGRVGVSCFDQPRSARIVVKS